MATHTPTQTQTHGRPAQTQPQNTRPGATQGQTAQAKPQATKPAAPAQPTQAPAPTNGNGNATTPQAPTGEPVAEPLTFQEAPYSWNTSAIGASGYVQQFTVRAQAQGDFIKRIATLLFWMEQHQYKPAPVRTFGGKGAPRKETVALPTAPHCPQHSEPMHPRQWNAPDNTVMYFWSCPHREGRDFCKARVNERPTEQDFQQWKELNQ